MLAGALDFVENAGIQKTVDAGIAMEPWPRITATASGIKWLLIALFGVFVLTAIVHRIIVPK